MITSINEYKKIDESNGINHTRVIPRDFFNEGKLLKCMGFLALRIHEGNLPEGINIKIEENGEAFDVMLSHEYGCLYVSNYPVMVNGIELFFGTVYNSKDNFPLVCYTEDYEEFRVFDEAGKFDVEFIERFTSTESVQESRPSNLQSTNLNYKSVERNDILWLTVMLKPRNSAPGNRIGEIGVVKVRVLDTFYGLDKLKHLKASDKVI